MSFPYRTTIEQLTLAWKNLNGRKRELEKDLHKGDDAKIMKLQWSIPALKP